MLNSILKEVNRFVSIESKKIIQNIGWLFFDKVFRMGMGLVVGAWVARYFGPSGYGAFNYLYAAIGMFTAFAGLGMDGMIVKEIVDAPQRTETIVSTAFTMRLLAGFLSFLICVVLFYVLKHDEMYHFYVGIVLAVVLMSQSLNVIELYFQSQVASKITVIAQSVAYIIMSICKVAMILLGGGLFIFAIITAAEITLAGLFMLIAYRKQGKLRLRLHIDLPLAKHFLAKSWPLIFAAFMIMIYMRIDQVMLGEMIGDAAVGTYSAALKLSEIWYFVPGIICTSLYPSIIEAKKQGQDVYYRKLQKLLDILFFLSCGIALGVTFCSDFIIHILYGDEYKDAGIILAIHIWTAVFVFFGTASSNYFVIEGLQIKSFIRTALGAVLNIVLNLFLIPRYGAIGAAVATLISQACSSYVFDLLSRKTRVLFVMKTRALLAVNFFRMVLPSKTS